MRIVAIGDLHCGHRAGLTPPQWWVSEEGYPKTHAWQKESWERYTELIEAQFRRGPVDLLIANGDLIDGRGEKSGSTELITTNRVDQTDMAIACIDRWRARNVAITFGTAYHTGKSEDWEQRVAEHVGGYIADRHQLDCEGVVFDVRHHVGSSGIPHGRHTAASREAMWNKLLAAEGTESKANVIIRSHVHYHSYCGGPEWLAMTLPALQGAGSKYGKRRCTGRVDWGITWFEVNNGEVERWKAETIQMESQKIKKTVVL